MCRAYLDGKDYLCPVHSRPGKAPESLAVRITDDHGQTYWYLLGRLQADAERRTSQTPWQDLPAPTGSRAAREPPVIGHKTR